MITTIPIVSLRLVREGTVKYKGKSFTDAEDVYSMAKDLIGDFDREALMVFCLDTKNRLLCLQVVSIGSADMSIASPREILKVAVLSNATGIILCHNHPSGDPVPSNNDLQITERIKDASRLLDIRFLDHVIIGDGGYYSIADENGI